MEAAAVAGSRAAARLGVEIEAAAREVRVEYAKIASVLAEDLEHALIPLGNTPSSSDVRLAIAEHGVNGRYLTMLSAFVTAHCRE